MPSHLDVLGKTLMDHILNQMIHNNDHNNIRLMTYIKRIQQVENGFISFTNHETNIHSKFILITHGGGMFVPRPLGIEDEGSFKNLFYHVEDASQFLQKKLVIFGGGDSATDWAHYFIKKGSNVTLIHRRDDFRGDARLLEEIQTHATMYTPYKIESVIKDNQRIKSVRISHLKTKDVVSIDCDFVLVFFGTIPIKMHPLHDDLLLENQRLIVSTSMETSIKGIFASGNGVFYPGKQSMIITALGEVATAMGSIIYDLYPDKIPSYKRT
jgi:thioredoxin reductase (NADPH)